MIAATISFFGEFRTKTQLEAEIEFGQYQTEEFERFQINKQNPYWSTFVFKDQEEAAQWINKCKKLKSFSCVVAIRDTNTI